MRPFDYHQPATLAEASALLQGLGGRASLLAGGTDLLVQIRENVRTPEHVVDLKKIAGLDGLVFDKAAGLRIGALATTRAVETAPFVRRHYAGLAEAVTHFASIQVRHRATVVGNVCRASPSADTLPPLIADAGVLHLHGPAGRREVAVEDFCTGPGRTVLADGELAVALVVPAPAPHTGKVYLKHGRRNEMELATVGVAVTLTLAGDRVHDLRIVLAAVAPTPLRARRAEAVLRGRPLADALIDEAARTAVAESRPIGDVRGSAEYRRAMVGVLTARAIEQAAQRAREHQS